MGACGAFQVARAEVRGGMLCVRACRRAPPAVCMPKRPRIRSARAGQRPAPRHRQGEGPTAKSGRDSAQARARSTVKCCQNPGQIKSEPRSDRIRTGGQMNRNPQPELLEVDPAPSRSSWRNPETRDPDVQKYFYENIQQHVRQRFKWTFDVMGYGGPGTDCPPFIPNGYRHEVREAYLAQATAGRLSRPPLNRARFKFPGTTALLRHLWYRRHRGRV